MNINLDLLKRMARLAKLQLPEKSDSEATHRLLKDLDDTLALVHLMNKVDCKNVVPLNHPLDIYQPRREDKVGVPCNNKDWSAMAPVFKDGFFIVPRIMENKDE